MSEPLYPPHEPSKYLELAKELSSKSETAAKRTAVDKAYYAAFLTCRDRLAAKGYITPHYSIEDHKYVATALKHIDTLASFGNEESRLRRIRNKVTYDTRELRVRQGVRPIDWIISIAEEIIRQVEALPDRH